MAWESWAVCVVVASATTLGLVEAYMLWSSYSVVVDQCGLEYGNVVDDGNSKTKGNR